MDEICYEKDFLSNVIARVDFASPIEAISAQLPPVLATAALKAFPIAEPRKQIAQQFQISASGLQRSTSESTQWRFHGKSRDKTLTIVPEALFVEYNVYRSYEILKGDFFGYLAVFFGEFKDAQARRLGLRYINNIQLDEDNPLAWDRYLSPEMLSTLRFYPHPECIARAFSVLEMNFGDFNLRYQFGIPNPDYPATIRRKIFTLDLDAYAEGLQDYGDITGKLDKFHDQIQNLFESSIKDELRDLMHGKATPRV